MNQVFGITFSELTREALAQEIAAERVPVAAGPRLVVTANLDHIVRLRDNADFRRAYDEAWVATVDGMPVYAYARSRGVDVPERVTGSDLFADLMTMLAPGKHRCFFVASSAETAEGLVHYLQGRGFTGTALAADVPPYGFESDADYSLDLAKRIKSHGTTHLFFGVGAPKSEIWITEHRSQLGDCYALAVGAGLDFFIGAKRRAPRWMQGIGIEWLWRFAQEPKRMFRRYFVDSWHFVSAIHDDLNSKGKAYAETSHAVLRR